MNKIRISRNIGITLLNTIFSGVVLYVVYRYLMRSIGPESIGVWAVVTGVTSFGRVGGMGLSGSVVKFVAQYSARGRQTVVSKVIETAAITILVVTGALLAIAYIPLIKLISYLLPEEGLGIALEILPLAIVTLWTSSVAGVFQSGLEGVHRFDLPALANMAFGLLYLLLVVTWVPHYGVYGVVYAQVCQAAFLTIGLWIALKREVPGLNVVPLNWEKRYFLEMLGYGVNFQIGSLLQLLLDPVTKALMVRFGGLSMVAYFEMANRMVVQFRAIPVSINRIVVPLIAEYKENGLGDLRPIYVQSFRILLYFSIPMYVGVAALAPVISEIWVGRFEPSFVGFTVILSFGWMINTLVGPAYMGNLGTGELRWNTIYHAVNGVLNTVLGGLFGMFWGGEGVAVGFVMSIVIASIILLQRYQSKNAISFSDLNLGEYMFSLLGGVGALVSSWLLFGVAYNRLEPALVSIQCLAIILVVFGIAARRHPITSLILSRIGVKSG